MEDLNELLAYLRTKRGFDAQQYFDKKIQAVNKFFTSQKLDSAVIGISGGIDSAVAFGLLLRAKETPGSPIKYLMPLNIPIHGDGTSNQQDSSHKASIVVNHFGYSRWLIDLTKVYQEMIKTCQVYSLPTPWANGQMASVLRTPVMYYHAALLQSQGYKSIVCGTINRDEGGFLGYYGKGSDAMVDLQPIADLHKSEVYALARLLEIPQSIIEAQPTGDVFDARTDLEMIGVEYDMIELFTLFRDYQDNSQVYSEINGSDYLPEELEKWESVKNVINAHHEKNAHKYQVGMPSHFIDVMPRKVVGGWQ